MPLLVVETLIYATPERCFDLARDIGLHVRTAGQTGERAVAGRVSGLIELGETVTFEGVHFGVRQRLTAQITELQYPTRFVDEMTQGAFERMTHLHEFIARDGKTLMRDTLDWTAPFGILGKIADRLFLINHMKQFLIARNAELKRVAELETKSPFD